MRYDVIVAGAGPAGSTAARECAARGFSTLLLDRAEFPRDKPCGGGVNVRAARLLPFDLAPVAERPIHGMRISVRQKHSFLCRSDEPISYLTQRRHLDTYLVEQAASAGVEFRERLAVRVVERHGDHVGVRAGTQVFEGRSLIVADGANGTTAAMAGIRVARSKEIALEGNITPSGSYPPAWHDVLGIDIGSVPGGYGWLFPKGEHLNIGVGGLSSAGPSLRPRLLQLTRYYGFDPADFWGLRGHPLPVRRPGAALNDGNVLLVGDAAGLLDPLTGEGIYGAIWSGQAAADHLAGYLAGAVRSLDGYRLQVERELEPELMTALQIHRLFHLSPAVWGQFVHRWPRAWRLVCALITGDATYVGVKARSRAFGVGIEWGSAAVERWSQVELPVPVRQLLERRRGREAFAAPPE